MPNVLTTDTWEANAAYTQSCLSALNSAIADGHEWAQHGMRQANALLAIGEAVAERAGLRRYQAGEGKPRDRFRFDTAKALRACAAVTFTEAELRAIGVEPFDLLPFDFSRVDPQVLRKETINWTSLERRPVSRTEDGIVVLLPTAIGAAVRRRALQLARDNQAGDAYEGHLTEHQFLGAVGDAVRGLDLSPAAPLWSDVDSHCVVQLCRFDAGAYCQVIFMPDRPDDVIAEGFRSVQDVSAPVRRLITEAAAECSARDDYLRGMTLLVFGGQGRGVVADHGRPPDGWQIVGLGYDDLSLLASAGEIDALRIFRILEQEDQLARRGIQLFNPNGFMNLYGMAEEQDFTLLPEQVDHSAPSMIQMGTDHLSKLRIRIRQALDKHSVARPSRGYRAEVQRPSALPLFEAASTESAFVSVDDLRHGHPAVAIEGSRTTWWLTIEASDPITAGSLPFRVWDMAQNWLIPLAPELEIHLGEELPGHVEVVLTFGRIDEQELLAEEGKIEPPNVSLGGGTIRISCAEPYLRSFSQPGNQGDRWMVRAIASGAAGLANQDPAACADVVERAIVKDDPQALLDVILGLAKHMEAPSTEEDGDPQVIRLHRACKAVQSWPTGLDDIEFSASPTGQTLPPLMQSYAALGAEPAIDAAEAEYASIRAMNHSTCGDELDRIVGLREASAISGLEDDTLRAAWEACLITRRYRAHGNRLLPAFEVRELLAFAEAWRTRVSASSVASRFGLPKYAIEQCVIRGHLIPTALSLPGSGYFFSKQAADRFCDETSLKQPAPHVATVALYDLMRLVSGRLKPWGEVLSAVALGRISAKLEPGDDNQLAKRLQIDESSAKDLIGKVAAKGAPSLCGLSSTICQSDAYEVLNCSATSSGMLDGIASTGINPKLFPLELVAKRAGEVAATSEIAKHLDLDPTRTSRLLSAARVREIVPGGWDRAHAFELINRATLIRDAQLSLGF